MTTALYGIRYSDTERPDCTPFYEVLFNPAAETYYFGPFQLSMLDWVHVQSACRFHWFRHIEDTFVAALDPMRDRFERVI